MNKLILLFLTSFIALGINATTLKNGAPAPKKRIDQVWKSVHKIQNYPLLLCLAMDCKEGKTSELASDWGYDQEVITEWTKLGILKDGTLNRETQEIIICSYFGEREAEWGYEAPKKIALATPHMYPAHSWVEKIPGYNLVQKIKRAKRIFSRVIPSERTTS